MFICLIIVSNQFLLALVVKNGQRNLEFKLLADWYTANSKPGEKILTTMPSIVRIFAPEHKDSLIHTTSIQAESSEDFARKCFDKNITYIAWDSRMGTHVGRYYYNRWGLKNIDLLASPQSTGQYEFITQLRVSEARFINVFRLRKPMEEPVGQRQ
ncbi:MAG: hypothetical protein ACYS9Y_06590 [Planctomycetota bacterium]|jgi:hypothetical protein